MNSLCVGLQYVTKWTNNFQSILELKTYWKWDFVGLTDRANIISLCIQELLICSGVSGPLTLLLLYVNSPGFDPVFLVFTPQHYCLFFSNWMFQQGSENQPLCCWRLTKKKKRNGAERQTFVGAPPSEAHRAGLWAKNWSRGKKKMCRCCWKGSRFQKLLRRLLSTQTQLTLCCYVALERTGSGNVVSGTVALPHSESSSVTHDDSVKSKSLSCSHSGWYLRF